MLSHHTCSERLLGHREQLQKERTPALITANRAACCVSTYVPQAPSVAQIWCHSCVCCFVVVTQGRWFQRHPFSHAVGVVTEVAAALKADYGVKKVGLQG